MNKNLSAFIVMVCILVMPSAVYAEEVVNPDISKTPSVMGGSFNQYFLESHNGKSSIIIKDINDDAPIRSVTQGENFIRIRHAGLKKNADIKKIEYTCSGIVLFGSSSISIRDNTGKIEVLTYPDGIKPRGEHYPDFGFVSFSDGEDVYMIVRSTANVYRISTDERKISRITTLKDFSNDVIYPQSTRELTDDYKLLTISESYGEPHLGFRGHCILIKDSTVKGYWVNSSYRGGSTMPTYAGQDFVAAVEDGKVILYDLPSLKKTGELPLEIEKAGIERASGRYAVIRNNKTNILHIYDLTTGEYKVPYKIMYSGDQRKVVEEDDLMINQGDSLECIDINGDNFTFVTNDCFRFEPPPEPGHYDCGKAPEYKYSYNFKTGKYTKEKFGTALDSYAYNSLINSKGLDMSIIEGIEKHSVYDSKRNLKETFDYPRRLLGIYAENNIKTTYYIENIQDQKTKSCNLHIHTMNLNTYNSQLKTIRLPDNCFDSILDEGIAVVPFSKGLYLLTTNNIFKLGNTSVAKTIPVKNIKNYSVVTDGIYLYSKNEVFRLGTNDKLVKVGPNNYTFSLAGMHPDNKADREWAVKQLESAVEKNVSSLHTYRLGLVCSQAYYYAEAAFSDGSAGHYLLAEGSVLNLPGTLKNKKYFIYKTTEKQFGTPVKKHYKLTVVMPDKTWEYKYKTEYPVIVSKTKAKIIYNDKEVSSDTYPVVQNGSLLIPVRALAEELGVKVEYDSLTKSVLLSKDGLEIQFRLNSSTASVNNKDRELTSPVILVNNRAMVPLRFISENLNLEFKLEYNTEYDPDLQSSGIKKVLLYSK